MEAVKVTSPVTVEVSKDQVAGLLCCAFEGGSNYWYLIDNDRCVKPPEVDPELQKSWGDFFHIAWPLSEGGSLDIVDRELPDEEQEHWTLNWEACKRGLEVMARKYPRHFADFVGENDDAITGDVFLQCCLFGKLVYG
jgi:hypothetical protein